MSRTLPLSTLGLLGTTLCLISLSSALVDAQSPCDPSREISEDEMERAYWSWVQGGDRSELDAIAKRVPLWPLLSRSLQGKRNGKRLGLLSEWQAAEVLGEYRVREALPALIARLRRHLIERPPIRYGDDIDDRQVAVKALAGALAEFGDPSADAAILDAAKHCDGTDDVQWYLEGYFFSALPSYESHRYDLMEALIPYARDWGRRHPELADPYEEARCLEAIVQLEKERRPAVAPPGNDGQTESQIEGPGEGGVSRMDSRMAGARPSPEQVRGRGHASWLPMVLAGVGLALVVVLCLRILAWFKPG